MAEVNGSLSIAHPTMSATTTTTAMLMKKDALRVLEHNQMKLERLLLELMAQPNTIRMFMGEDGEAWSFTTRRRCHLFLMAKCKEMKKYETIYSTSK